MDAYQITFNTWNNLAQWYEDTFMNLAIYNQSYDAFCRAIHIKNANVLELGCGPGNATKYLLSQRPDFKLLATDISPNMLEYAKKNNPSASFQMLDIRELNSLPLKFDAILSGFCLPYLSKQDLEKMLVDAYQILNTEGILYLSCIEGEYAQSGLKSNNNGQQSLQFYYDFDFLKSALEKQNFKLLQHFKIPYTTQPDKTTTHLVLIAQK